VRSSDQAQLPIWGDRRQPLAVRYAAWRLSEEGRDVAHQITQLALAAAAADRKRISINLLFEQLRLAQHRSVDNSFRAFLARELRDKYPELKDRIHVKDRKARAA
jgi:hypothetical protein